MLLSNLGAWLQVWQRTLNLTNLLPFGQSATVWPIQSWLLWLWRGHSLGTWISELFVEDFREQKDFCSCSRCVSKWMMDARAVKQGDPALVSDWKRLQHASWTPAFFSHTVHVGTTGKLSTTIQKPFCMVPIFHCTHLALRYFWKYSILCMKCSNLKVSNSLVRRYVRAFRNHV